MATPNFFDNQPWTALDKGQSTIFDDDFVHSKLFTLNAARFTPTSSIYLKQSISQKDGKITTTDQLKFSFPFNQTKTLYTRIKTNEFKLHYDHGAIIRRNHFINLYGSVQGKRILANNIIYKLGCDVQRQYLFVGLRLRYNSSPKNQDLTVYNKIRYNKGTWSFGAVNGFNLYNQMWNLSTFQLGWTYDNKTQYYLHLNGGEFEQVRASSLIRGATIAAIYKYTDNTKLGVKLEGSITDAQLTNATFIWDHKSSTLENVNIKIKGDLNRNVSFSIKNQIANYGSYIFGVNILNFGVVNKLSYGIQLNLDLQSPQEKLD